MVAISIDTRVRVMGIVVRRKNRRVGASSDFMNIPKPIIVGEESPIADNRLILSDPRGEILEDAF